jgi:monoamine oxidase
MLLPTLTTPRLEALARTTEIGAGVPLEDLSAKYWGFGRGFGGTDAAPVGGYVEVIEKLRGEIQKAGVEVRLEEEVVGIEDRADGGVQVTTRGGQVYRARTCISTIPLGVLKISPPAFDPPLPPQFLSALQRTAVGVLEKVVLSYSKAWWPEPSTTGTFLVLPTLASTPNPGSLADVFASTTLSVNTFTFAKTPSPSILVYLGANAGASMSPYSSSEIGTALHTYLKARLSVPSAPSPLSTLSTNWLSDPFSRGATSSPVTLAQSDDGERASPLDFVVLGRSMWEGRMGFAGEHTDMDSRGSVVGAVVSGEREGRRVKEMLDRSSLGKL